MRIFYLVMAVIGTVIPWIFFGSWFFANGFDATGFILALFANGATGGFSADVLISIIVFWVWSFHDSRENGVKEWWISFAAGYFVGLSLALPLYLFFREGARSHRPGHSRRGAL